jgi:hypothetical protein
MYAMVSLNDVEQPPGLSEGPEKTVIFLIFFFCVGGGGSKDSRD